MGNENLLVLICKDYESHPDSETKVLDIDDAVSKLGKKGLLLKIDSGESWHIEMPDSALVHEKIGQSCPFNAGNYSQTRYRIGVYNRNSINHMQEMVDSVRLHESLRVMRMRP